MNKKKPGSHLNKTENIGIRLTPEARQEIEQAAWECRRTVSNWIEMACLWALENNAVDEKPRPLKRLKARKKRETWMGG